MRAGEKAKYPIGLLLVTSDWHWLTVPVGKQKGQILRGFEKIVEKTIDIWKRLTVHVWIPRMLKRIGQIGPVDLIIHGGDLIESEYNERGMVLNSDVIRVKRDIQDIRKNVCYYPPMHIAPGDHEMGYKLPLSKDPKGGVSLTSIHNCVEAFGSVFSHFTVDQFHFILLSSSLFIQPLSHRPESEQAKIKALVRQQEDFLIKNLLNIPAGKTVFIFLHDPDALVRVDEIVNDKALPKQFREKKIRAFCGHLHSEGALNAYKRLGLLARSKWARFMPEKIRNWAAGNLERIKVFERYHLRVIPAPGGMLGFGKGFLTMSIYGDGTWEIERKKI